MVDVTVKVLEPASYLSFLSLEEAKKALGLPATGSTPEADDQLQFQIDSASAIIFRLCNRMFAKTTVMETWRDNRHETTYLRLWPVEDDDVFYIGPINGPVVWPPPPPPIPAGSFELENFSGKLRKGGDFSVIYSGGYLLPDDAPDDLKHACIMLLRQQRTETARESVEGIRMIAHKESRVIFFDPNAAGAKTTQAALSGSSGIPTVDALLEHYVRFWA
jgi:hypothetical protein